MGIRHRHATGLAGPPGEQPHHRTIGADYRGRRVTLVIQIFVGSVDGPVFDPPLGASATMDHFGPKLGNISPGDDFAV